MINNKKNGFAITALLYGLSIMTLMVVALMMSVMQNSRKNSSTLVRSIEEELNAYGETTQQYTSSGDYFVPEGQSGYFKIELQKGTTLVTGTIFLVEGTRLIVNLDSNPATLTVDEGSTTLIMDTNGFILGSAQNATGTNRSKYQFLNGQRITNTSSQTRFKATKVAEVAPVTNDMYNNVTKITASSASKIIAVSFDANKSAVSNNANTVWQASGTSLTVNGNISEIYVEYNSNVKTPSVQLTRNVNGAVSTVNINSTLHSDYSFNKGGYTLSRFGPTNTGNQTLPKNGNYYFSLVSKSSNVFTLDQENTLSTTFYTPTSVADANNKANEGKELIKYGNESFGRPVANVKYEGKNSQKWRVEALGSGLYKILEIEEYKPFEVHKQDATFDSKEPNGPGPILICGAYTFIGGVFTSTDSFTDNTNQKWSFEPAGLGTYYLRTNHTAGTRYLYYDTSTSGKNRYHVTNSKEKASIFQLTNADL